MPRQSAGLLVYRRKSRELQVFLVHPGGPLWAQKDLGAWSIPKGEFAEGEDRLAAARREFAEETGSAIDGTFIPLTARLQPSRKLVHAWAIEGDVDEASLKSNEFEIEWPPKSGKMQRFAEVDRGVWFAIVEARRRIHRGQIPFLDELVSLIEKPGKHRTGKPDD
jgi:predicted NUDIX family NTP pyrophosphohydrolase